jgi:3-hydroxyacyl-CoA dehydrogenase/enoyl-CoA hydratase/3-hydroxybutyryl-CoA epimerase
MGRSNLAEKIETAASAFRFSFRDDGIGVIEINVPGEKQNTLKEEFGAQFDAAMDEVRAAAGLKGLIICSSKPGSFVAGADINLFDHAQSVEEVTALSQACQRAFAQLESLTIPVVAAINGACLGGGLELALACHARIAADNDKTALGLPEVMLGLLPAGGGTQRLPRLVGIAKALDLMLTGRALRPVQAKKLGLVDAVVPADILMEAATKKVLALTVKLAPSSGDAFKSFSADPKTALTNLALEGNPAGRRVLFRQARKQALSKTLGNYPAAEAILRVVEEGYCKGLIAGYAAEACEFGLLAMSPQSAGLRSLFHASEALKKERYVKGSVKERKIQNVGVLGAGLMGAGIALTSVEKADCAVRLKDRDAKGLGLGLDYLNKYYDRRVSRKAMSAAQAQRQCSRVTLTVDYSGFASCDVVIEAVFESLELKQQMLRDIEALGNERIIFGSNTSSIPISKIAAIAKRPENVIGLHYFSPVEKMPMLEIITTEHTSPEVTATCVAFGKAQGKTVIVVKDAPGFYTTRVLAPYLNEATRMVAEGVDPRLIDKALALRGYPVGAITLLDEVGIDVGLKVGPMLFEAFGERLASPDGAEAIMAAGSYGRKSGKGFYRYADGKVMKDKAGKLLNDELYTAMKVKPGSKKLSAEEIADRCNCLQANEAVYCLQEGILPNAMSGDIGAVFGLGFPPFTGGPFRWIDQVGVAKFIAKLEALQGRYGMRFEPAPLLREMMSHKSRFHHR